MKVTALLLLCMLVSAEAIVQLQGRWKEDSNKRQNLDDFLSAFGMNWFKRQYVTVLTSWANEQTIHQTGNVFEMHGIRGPKQTTYHYTLTADNSTLTFIDGGELGGAMLGRSFLKGDTALIIDLVKQDTGEPIMRTERFNLPGSNEMIYTSIHKPTGTVLKSFYYKQQ